MNIIVINGKAGSGKDTVANYLLKQKGFQKISFADPIKRFIQELWGFSYEQLWGSSEKRLEASKYNSEITVRKALQFFGNDACRKFDENVFAKWAVETAKTLLTEDYYEYIDYIGLEDSYAGKKAKCVVIPDGRYKNELEEVKKNNGILLRVKRPKAGLKGIFGKHKSETEMDDIPDDFFDYVIDNNGTLQDLEKKIDAFMQSCVK